MVYYTDLSYDIPAPPGAEKLALMMLPSGTPEVVAAQNGMFHLSTSGKTAGRYAYQIFDAQGVMLSGTLELRNNILSGGDPRSQAEITLEAIDAALANRATVQQRRISVGDKSIEYSTLSELLQWREHYARLVRIEQGKAPSLRREIYILNGGWK